MKENEYSEEVIDYFKEIFLGTNTKPWKVWWNENQEELSNSLTRGEFVRLKVGKIDYIYKILQKLNFKVKWSKNAYKEKFLSEALDQFVDESGNITHSYFKNFFRNCIKDFYKGELSLAKDKIIASLKTMKNKSKEKKEAEQAEIFLTLFSVLPTGIYSEFFSFVLEVIQKSGPKSLNVQLKEIQNQKPD